MGKKHVIEKLKEKEYIVLALWTCNQSVKQCAKYLNLSDRTVENYRDRIRCKFGALSSDELIDDLLFTEDYQKLIDDGRKFIFSHKKNECRFMPQQSLKQQNIIAVY